MFRANNGDAMTLIRLLLTVLLTITVAFSADGVVTVNKDLFTDVTRGALRVVKPDGDVVGLLAPLRMDVWWHLGRCEHRARDRCAVDLRLAVLTTALTSSPTHAALPVSTDRSRGRDRDRGPGP